MFTVLSLKGCPWCQRARQVLVALGYPYKTLYPSKNGLLRRTGRATYPQVFDGPRHVGGFEDLKAYLGLARTGRASQKPCCR